MRGRVFGNALTVCRSHLLAPRSKMAACPSVVPGRKVGRGPRSASIPRH